MLSLELPLARSPNETTDDRHHWKPKPCLPAPRLRRRKATRNPQPTTNSQWAWRAPKRNPRFDVGCWMFLSSANPHSYGFDARVPTVLRSLLTSAAVTGLVSVFPQLLRTNVTTSAIC